MGSQQTKGSKSGCSCSTARWSTIGRQYNTDCCCICFKVTKTMKVWASQAIIPGNCTSCFIAVPKSFLRRWYAVWINYMIDEGKVVHYGKLHCSKQLIKDLIAAGDVPIWKHLNVQIISHHRYQKELEWCQWHDTIGDRHENSIWWWTG